jgi:Tol biopolymer transport system component
LAVCRRFFALVVAALAGAALFTSVLTAAQAPLTAIVSAVPANGDSSVSSISADGRFVVFDSAASNFVAGDTNRHSDVFVRDRRHEKSERVSITSGGAQADGGSGGAAISGNGRLVAFTSEATNLVGGDSNERTDVFVRDRVKRTTVRVSVGANGTQANAGSAGTAISADGRFVVFISRASNLVAGDTNKTSDVFLRDRFTRTTTRVSVGRAETQANGPSGEPAISAGGRYVAFSSQASNLVGGDGNKRPDVFVRDRVKGTTTRVSFASRDALAWWPAAPAISADGRFIAFDLYPDVFVRDLAARKTIRVSVSSRGASADDVSSSPAMSADGRLVAFSSQASNLVTRETSPGTNVFVRDRVKGTTTWVSTFNVGPGRGSSDSPVMSATGRFVAFDSEVPGLAAGLDILQSDVVVRDRFARRTALVTIGRNLRPRVSWLLLKPWPVRAGTPLRATLRISAGGRAVARAGATCIAELDGHKLVARSHRFAGSGAHCMWRIPSDARGKRLKGSVAVSNSAGTAGRRFVGTVGRRPPKPLPPEAVIRGNLLTNGKITEIAASGTAVAALVDDGPRLSCHTSVWNVPNRRVFRIGGINDDPCEDASVLTHDLAFDGRSVSWYENFCGNECYDEPVDAVVGRDHRVNVHGPTYAPDNYEPKHPKPRVETRRGITMTTGIDKIHLRRVSDGRSRTIRVPGLADVDLTGAGLFYAYNTQTGHAVFVRFDRLLG